MFAKTIFDPDSNADLINRINQLTVATPALWGQMNTAQMLAHMQVGLNIAFGKKERIWHWIGFCFGSIGKRRLLKRGDFDRHMPTFKQAKITHYRTFNEEKVKLTGLIKYALENGPGIVVKYPHPYFSTFKDDEWARLNWKHFDHHLRQFGV
jgi:hypothetical protein